LTITDLAANEVQVTLTGDLTGQQTITGLWLDAVGLSSISIGNASGPAVPFAIGSGSTYSVTQTTVPNGSKALTGAYDLYVKFANNGASASLQGTASESFTLTGTGLSASLFATPAAQTSGQPSPDFDAMMAVTNDLGTAGSGTGYFGAVTPVPLPAALPLVIAGLVSVHSAAGDRPPLDRTSALRSVGSLPPFAGNIGAADTAESWISPSG
jgi:hypothetical protein